MCSLWPVGHTYCDYLWLFFCIPLSCPSWSGSPSRVKVHSAGGGIAAQYFSLLAKDTQSPQSTHTWETKLYNFCIRHYVGEQKSWSCVSGCISDLISGLVMVIIQGHLHLFILLSDLLPLCLQFWQFFVGHLSPEIKYVVYSWLRASNCMLYYTKRINHFQKQQLLYFDMCMPRTSLLVLCSSLIESRLHWPWCSSSDRLVRRCNKSCWVMDKVSWRLMMGITKESEPYSE